MCCGACGAAGVPGAACSSGAACGVAGVLGIVGPGCWVCRSVVAFLLMVLVVPVVFWALSGLAAVCAGFLALLVVPLAFRALSGLAAVCAGFLALLVVPLAFRARPISGRRVACPPSRRLRCELSARRVVSNPGLALQASRRPLIGRCLSLVCCRSGPCGVLRTGGACVADRRLGASSRSPDWPVGLPPWPATASWPVGTAISHAIPLYLFQTLNSNRWNCNVFRRC